MFRAAQLAAILALSWSIQADSLVVVEPALAAGVYFHVTATFGPSLSEEGTNGTVVEAAPVNACEALTNDPDGEDSVDGKVVLVQRGSCDFVEKVRNAQRAGAVAVVVANDQGEHLFKMYSSDDDTGDVDIPSVFVTTSTGAAVRGAYVVLNATGEYEFGDDDFMHPYFFMAIILLGLSVTLACTLTATLVGYVVVSFKTRRQRGECHRVVARLKTRTLREGDCHGTDSEDGSPCTICLDDFVPGDCVKELPCGHMYHKACIDPWLLTKSSLCPLCKQNIMGANVMDMHATPGQEQSPASEEVARGLEANLLGGAGGGGDELTGPVLPPLEPRGRVEPPRGAAPGMGAAASTAATGSSFVEAEQLTGHQVEDHEAAAAGERERRDSFVHVVSGATLNGGSE